MELFELDPAIVQSLRNKLKAQTGGPQAQAGRMGMVPGVTMNARVHCGMPSLRGSVSSPRSVNHRSLRHSHRHHLNSARQLQTEVRKLLCLALQ